MSLIALTLALATPAAAQAAPAQPATAQLDPARLAAARALIDVVMPPETRDGMIDAMLKPMMANLKQAALSSPALAKDIGDDPKLRAVLDRFIARRTDAMLAKLRAGLPDMFTAMERAYARRFTVQQMADATAFFATPSGRTYMREGMTIMADPDVQAWQRTLMLDSMGDMKGDLAELMTELETAEKSK